MEKEKEERRKGRRGANGVRRRTETRLRTQTWMEGGHGREWGWDVDQDTLVAIAVGCG